MSLDNDKYVVQFMGVLHALYITFSDQIFHFSSAHAQFQKLLLQGSMGQHKYASKYFASKLAK